MAKAAKEKTTKVTKSTRGKTKPSKAKRAKLDSDASVTSTDDEASSYEQGTDEGSVVVLSDEEEEEDEGTPVTESDDDSSSKKRKGSSSKKSSGKKGKDDRNTRIVKQVKKAAGPAEDGMYISLRPPDARVDLGSAFGRVGFVISPTAATAVILPTTLQFLKDLVGHNDREWFQENGALLFSASLLLRFGRHHRGAELGSLIFGSPKYRRPLPSRLDQLHDLHSNLGPSRDRSRLVSATSAYQRVDAAYLPRCALLQGQDALQDLPLGLAL